MIDLESSCRPPVCNALHCGFPGRCTGPKLYQRVPPRQVSICLFRVQTLCHKTHWEKTSRRKRKRELFWDTENHACIGLARVFSALYLLLRTWDDRHRELCSSRFGGLSLGTFIKSNRLNRIARLFEKYVCSSYTVLRSQYDRLSQQQLSFLLCFGTYV